MKALARFFALIGLAAGGWLALNPTALPAQTVVVNAGSIWSYFHQGSAPPPGWNQPGVQPQWPMGAAKLGFGGDGEVTVLPDNGTLATYFRHEFFVQASAMFTNFLGRIVADDGAVVYLNGQEVARINMYPGPVTYGTPAATDLNRPQETNWVNFIPMPAPLRPGTNVLAVEVHQSGTASRDLGFALQWLANVPNLTPSLAILQPTAGNVLETGTNIMVRAAVTDPGNQVSNLVFSVDGEVRFMTTPVAPQFTLADLTAGTHVLAVHTILLDGTPVVSAPVAIRVDDPPGFMVVVPNGAVWRYLDDGPDPGLDWRELDFNDSTWAAGPAELGFGDADFGRPERTVIGFGGNPANKRITTYFRHAFLVEDPIQFPELVLRLLRDDGAVVYLNGIEIARENLPGGLIGPGTVAELAIDDGTVFHEIPLPGVALRAGENVLAVEVHQNSPESSDLSFDLMLLARGAPPVFVVQPASVILPYCIDATLEAQATGDPRYQWFRNGVPIPGAIEPFLDLTGVERDAAGLYHALAINFSGQATSAVAEVQVCLTKRGGPIPGVMATTNLQALVALENISAGGGEGGGAGGLALASVPPPMVHLSHGVPLYFATEDGGASPLVPFICGVPSTHTKWVGYYSGFRQRLRISTEGSDFDTVLGVYTNSGGLDPRLVEVACDRGNATEPAGIVEFDAERRFHYIAVDGENGETGTVRLKIGLGILQAPFHNRAADTFEFEVTVRSNITGVVRSTSAASLPGLTNFVGWTPYGEFTTNKDWVFPQSVPGVSALPRRYFGGRER